MHVSAFQRAQWHTQAFVRTLLTCVHTLLSDLMTPRYGLRAHTSYGLRISTADGSVVASQNCYYC